MQMTISRRDLKAAVLGFSKIVPHKTTLPVLGCIKFEVTGATGTATATDLDQHARFMCKDAVCDGPGAFLVPFQQLRDISRGPDADSIQFTPAGSDKVLVLNPVAGQAVRLELPVPAVEDWPAQVFKASTQPVDDFLAVFQRLAPFASTDINRHVINSCFLDVADGSAAKSVMVSTDGRRLTMCNTMTLPLKQSCIVPTTKFLSWLDGSSSIGIAKQGETHWFAVESGPWTYIVKAIDGTYPNYRQVIPKACDNNQIVFAEDIASARQILKALPVGDKQEAISLRSSPSGKLAVGVNDVCVDIPGSTFTGKCKQIGVNRDYLMDALDAGFRTFAFTDELSPIVSDDGKGGKHVLMPMRVTEHEPISTSQKQERPEGTAAVTPVRQSTTETVPEKPAQKGRTKMAKSETAIEKLQDSYETAKDKLKDASTALADLSGLIKDAVKEDRQRRSEIEDVRKTVARIQSIKV